MLTEEENLHLTTGDLNSSITLGITVKFELSLSSKWLKKR